MSEHGGVLSAAKEGAVPGLFIGVLVGSSRAYLNARDLAKETEAITTAAAQANPSISRAAINSLRPSVSTSTPGRSSSPHDPIVF